MLIFDHQIFSSMPTKYEHSFSTKEFKDELEEHGHNPEDLPGWMFEGLLLYNGLHPADDASLTDKGLEIRTKQAYDIARFAGARLTNDLKEGVTHIVVGQDRSVTKILRQATSK